MSLTASRCLHTGLMLGLYGCASNVTLPAAADAEFQPIAFFQGRSHGEGQLKKLVGAPIAVHVDSVGRMHDGTLILDQTITEAGKPPSTRRWTIVRVGQVRYSGTLTDAGGDVQATVHGARAEIRYRMKHGLTVEQQLAQQSDGKTLLNRLVVRKFGVRVATLSETIRKVN